MGSYKNNTFPILEEAPRWAHINQSTGPGLSVHLRTALQLRVSAGIRTLTSED